ncbi:MAG TPA: tripartite tricarboxylate transporter substrate binding protein [Burkholderiales bacterium]|nr:tripartite tricarboxylate transporter substrate binding protein [Burkholderiales bacterium]
MTTTHSNRRAALLCALFVPLGSQCAFAQTYPAKPVTFVVGFAAGGGADVVARILGEEMGKVLGRPIVVDNRPGAGGTIGADLVARAAPDGYTLFIGGLGPNATAHSLYRNLRYDSLKDFAPIGLFSENPNALTVHTSVPAKNVGELIALAKRQPGVLGYASAGNGSGQHLAGELFKSMARINIVHVPYKGVAAGMNDLLAGRIDLMFPPIFSVVPLAKAGRVRVLGVTTLTRSSALPDVPPIAQAGLPGYEQTAWNALLAPAGTPREIISILHAAIGKALASDELRRKFEAVGAVPKSSTPDQLAAFLRSETAKYGKLIKEAGVTVD